MKEIVFNYKDVGIRNEIKGIVDTYDFNELAGS